MGEIVGAGLVAHVPTIMLPEEVRLEINEGREITLVPGLHRMKAECLDRLKPDTVIVFDTHWESTFEHIVTAHERRSGRFTSHELPRGMAGIPYDMPVVGWGARTVNRLRLFSARSADEFDIEALIRRTEQVTGSLDRPGTGILFVTPVTRVVGLQPGSAARG